MAAGGQRRPGAGRAADPPASIRQYFLEWLEGDGYPFWSFWDNVASWWAIRHLPNLLLHFTDLKRDLPGQMRRVAAFLGITLEAAAFDAAVRHCSFAYMRAHAAKCVPRGSSFLKGGPHTFIHQGTNGRWRAVLSADDCRRYEAMAKERLGEPCARWLAGGGPLDQDASSHPSSPSHPDRARAPNPDTQSTGGPCPSSSPQ